MVRLPEPRRLPPHVRRKLAKGKTYYYFDTGRKTSDGKPILDRLPDIKDKAHFGGSYASKMGHRNRVQAATVEALTIAQMVDRYQRSPDFARLAENTRTQYNIYLTTIDRMIGVAPVADVGRATVRDLLDKMADRPGAANATLRTLRALFTWGKKRELVSINPASDIELHEAKDYEPWPEQLVAEAFESEDRRVRIAVNLLFFTAQRIGDVCRLRWSDIKGGVIFVTQQKTKKDLEIPVHPRLDLILGARPNEDGPLLPRADGGHYDPGTVRDVLQAFARPRGYKIVPHGLRKNAVNALLECGCSAAETAAISGQSLSLVEHYAKRRSTGKLAASAMKKLTGPKRESENL